MSNTIPNFEEWIRMSEEERWMMHLNWKVYAGEGQEIAMKVLEKFNEKFGNVTGLKIGDKVGVYHGGTWAIHVEHPFIFDRRRIPQRFLGIEVRGGASIEDLPQEFRVENREKEYIWAPERYEKFVDKCANEIRKELGVPNMSRDEMLDALVGGDFKKHIIQCKKWKKEGVIP